MSILGNRHVVVALLVAPILALIAYFAVDTIVAEKPHAAVTGTNYQLLARSNCRYRSGRCDLVNGEFELSLRMVNDPETNLLLELTSVHRLSAAHIGVAPSRTEVSEPVSLSSSGDALRWLMAVPSLPEPDVWLQLVARSGGSSYYAEIPVTFMQAEVDE